MRAGRSERAGGKGHVSSKEGHSDVLLDQIRPSMLGQCKKSNPRGTKKRQHFETFSQLEIINLSKQTAGVAKRYQLFFSF